MNPSIERLTPKRIAELECFYPHARFEIPTIRPPSGRDYQRFLKSLVSEMLLGLGAKSDEVEYMRTFDVESGQESGIGHFMKLRDRQHSLRGCKFYWYDGTMPSTPSWWKAGVLFRDHHDVGAYVIDEVFFLADALATLLTAKQISFALYVLKKADRSEEVVRAKFPD